MWRACRRSCRPRVQCLGREREAQRERASATNSIAPHSKANPTPLKGWLWLGEEAWTIRGMVTPP